MGTMGLSDSGILAPHERFLLGDSNSVIRANIVYSIGTVCERRGELEAALKWYRIALEQYPQHTISRYRAAVLCVSLGHYREAERELEAVAKLPSASTGGGAGTSGGAGGGGAPAGATAASSAGGGDLAGVGSLLMPAGVPSTDILLRLTMGKAKQQLGLHEAAIQFFSASIAASGDAGLPPGEPLLHRAQSWLAIGKGEVGQSPCVCVW
jgi:tetratricopeptide (TPR) repeat protein